MTVTVLLMDNR